jgi:hypothetical protein
MLLMNAGVGVGSHGPEFQALEFLAQVADAFLLEKKRAGRNDFNEHRDHQPERRPQDRRYEHTNYIKRALPRWNPAWRCNKTGMAFKAFLRKAVIAEIVHCASFTFNDGAKSKLIWSGKYFLYFMRPD